MAKKRKQPQVTEKKKADDQITVSDSIGDDILEKLKAAKKQLTAVETAKEEERQAQLLFERKQREKNKSFEELLEEYGDSGSKF